MKVLCKHWVGKKKGRKMKINFNDHWFFTASFDEGLLSETFDTSQLEAIRLPHSVIEMPYHYFDDSIYQMVSGYRKTFLGKPSWHDKKILVTFEGAAHEAEVYLNGLFLSKHSDGYTAFSVDLTQHLILDGVTENVLVVRLNSKETLNQPPFGHVIDYMTYGGLYREAWLEILPQNHVQEVFVWATDVLKTIKKLHVSVACSNRGHLSFTLKGPSGERVSLGSFEAKSASSSWTFDLKDVSLWSLDQPNLYDLIVEMNEGEHVYSTRFGFREAVFKKEGFYLNGEKIKLLGLNRHQSYPYVGYAMPKGPQIHDANLLKYELGCNAVRTSHYPQSKHFISRCDEIGLLVFTEMPGWQHIGDVAWQEVALKQVEAMVTQYRNHPSIVIWGVRINESMDNEVFYTKTNALAKNLDPSRQTGGVRYMKKSQLLEDVYTYNDFLHNGKTPGVDQKSNVTSNTDAPYLITEFNGHMYPTKAFDSEPHRLEHALRHARVLNGVFEHEEILGGFGWCMFDYNTHKDFGSGDRICYHGVMDMFRNNKLAASVYASQLSDAPHLAVSANMDVGEYPGGYRGDVFVFTNVDEVRLYKNKRFIRKYAKSDSPFKHLPNGPIKIDDFIGNQLVEVEGFSERKAKTIKKILMGISKYGPSGLPLSIKLLAMKAIVIDRFKTTDFYELYGKYIGDWGVSATTYTFEGIKEGEVVIKAEKKPFQKIVLRATADRNTLMDDATYDVATIRILATDELGNVMSFYQEPLTLTLEGPLALIGPSVVSLKGGMGGTYVKTMKQSGTGRLTLSAKDLDPIVLSFKIICKEDI